MDVQLNILNEITHVPLKKWVSQSVSILVIKTQKMNAKNISAMRKSTYQHGSKKSKPQPELKRKRKSKPKPKLVKKKKKLQIPKKQFGVSRAHVPVSVSKRGRVGKRKSHLKFHPETMYSVFCL